jgi:glutathione S-transferase
MRLYHCTNSRSLRAIWALEELGLDYALETLAFPPRTRADGYLDVNPLGTVPTLVDGATVLTESAAICQYLAERHGPTTLRVDPAEADYGAYLNWLFRSDATLTFPLTVVLRYSQHEPEERRLPQVVEDYTIWFLSRARSIEQALDGRNYLVADRFTMADIAVHFALFLALALGLRSRLKPRSLRYAEAMMGRPAFDRAMIRQGLAGWRQAVDAT